jgi:ParB/RepB/Spo0J family partition protein
MDLQLLASIQAIGLLQPPVVREIDGSLVVRAGDRRTKAAIAAGLVTIDVYVLSGNEQIDAMASMSENLIRYGLNPVDTWRGIDRLERQGWNEEAIANALALSVRTVRKLKLLGKLHPPVLDVMAKGSMPNDDQLRTIANAPVTDQEPGWKKLKPRKGHDVPWWEIARALSRPRIPFSAAKFDDKLAEEFGVVWEDDLFAPAEEESRYTTNADGFFGAQQAWMTANLPANGIVLPIGDHGAPMLPKGAERIYGKPTKSDKLGHYVNPRSGEIETVAYRPPQPKAKAGKGKNAAGPAEETSTVRPRPDVTQRGLAMIGDFRTDALHPALDTEEIPSDTLVGLLVLALAADNVSIQNGLAGGPGARASSARRISEGGVLTGDQVALKAAARGMLKLVLSCRANMTDSGASSRIAGETLGAVAHLPSMATEEFLACLSRQALERSTTTEGVKIEVRVKDTRAAFVKHFTDKTWLYPGAAFTQTAKEQEEAFSRGVFWTGDDGEDEEPESEAGENPGDTFGPDDERAFEPSAIAAE